MPAPSRARVTHPLIASDRIEGTLVCRFDGTQLGTVERLMINKISGQVAYAVVKCVDHPFVGKMRFPIRWDAMTYDRRRGAYLVDLTADEIRRAPPSTADSTGATAPTWRTSGRSVIRRSGARHIEVPASRAAPGGDIC